ncbi:peptidylprolyl isomerase [Waterburya agarophytonicola K14]|uniref:peptidylprolyl isomerase n=1 Tax=Waterburya agarophytonicola KI4 TaxID=2874699 RepID=A0A964FHG3_9CYAN|nr:peptidylprolyl isomerase [Waterburya agarophytonicola]MCC0177614.1 peptidylprolyl isomerase [Waterburya agarophytonicola KI4]
MNTKKNILLKRCQLWLANRALTSVIALTIFTSSLLGWQPQASAILAQGDAVTDPRAILQYSLPIENDSVRKLQKSLEDISNQLRGKRWKNIGKDLNEANSVLGYGRDKLLASIPEDSQPQAEVLIQRLTEGIEEIREIIDNKDREGTYLKRRELLDLVGDLEQLMVTDFPFEVPEEYSYLPQLLGRATVEMKTNKGDLTVVVDGYSAPINGGNFIDLVNRGFYDGLDFNRAEDFYILQAGDPPGEADGFIDPKTKEYRAIPMEVLVKGDDLPVYGETLEELGRYLDVPAIPFNAYGAMALARPADDPNGGSSQFFFFKFDTEITPPGYNLMDGRYSVFGYLIEGKEVLEELTAGDRIISAKVVDGIDNLQEPS